MKRSPMPPRSAPLRRDTGEARLEVPVLKMRTCPKAKGGCGEPYRPARPMQVCCFGCAAAVGAFLRRRDEAQKRREERAADKARRQKLKTRGDWIAEVQVAFNAYIRERDAGRPCICCGQPFEPDRPGGAVDAGHYLSRGNSPHLRFDERNVHAQRKSCNRPGGTTRTAFRSGMLQRIGEAALLALEADQSSPKWTIPELQAMKADYQARTRALRKARR